MYSQRGNILFLILLAVILFAALSYAVTSSMRGGGNDASKESVQAQASAILQYLDQASTAVMRMQMVEGIKPELLSFGIPYVRNDGAKGIGWSNLSCLVDSCKVFHPKGGGASAMFLNTYAPAPENVAGLSPTGMAPGQTMFALMQFPYTGSALNDVTMQVIHIKPDICDEIARRLSLPVNTTLGGNAGTPSDPTLWDGTAHTVTSPQEAYAGQNTLLNYGGTGAGRFCHIFRVLVVR